MPQITCTACPYAACIDICEDYGKKLPFGLKKRDPKEYWRRRRQLPGYKEKHRVIARESYHRKRAERMAK